MSAPIQSSPEAANAVVLKDHEFKIAQAVYGIVTGKTEKLTKGFKSPYLIDFSALLQLHSKLLQTVSPWDKLQSTDNITVYHTDDEKQVFSSIERFKLYDASHSAPVEAIVYEFNFLMRIPGVEKPQGYKIVVKLFSHNAIMSKIEGGEPSPTADFFRFMGSPSVAIEIDYVDFVIARSILAAFESWVKSLPIQSGGRLFDKAQRHSWIIPRLSGFAMSVITLAVCYLCIDKVLSDKSTIPDLAKFLLSTAIAFAVAIPIAKSLGRFAEMSVDELGVHGAIKINVGDQRLLTNRSTKNRWNLIFLLGSLAGILIEGVVVNVVSQPIVNRLFEEHADKAPPPPPVTATSPRE